MVQGEKSSMLTASSCVARTSDPYARKAGFEAMQRADKSSSSGSSSPFATKAQMAGSSSSSSSSKSFAKASSSSSSSSGMGSSASGTSYGSWGPVFQNKHNFASMHFC